MTPRPAFQRRPSGAPKSLLLGGQAEVGAIDLQAQGVRTSWDGYRKFTQVPETGVVRIFYSRKGCAKNRLVSIGGGNNKAAVDPAIHLRTCLHFQYTWAFHLKGPIPSGPKSPLL